MGGVEPIQLYCPGGYHPVHLGDKFNDRYTIEHKLGYGGYSTVWLARDPQKRLVALKIMVAAKPGDVDYEDILQEASFLRRLKPQPGASIGRPLSGVLYSSHTTPPSFFPTLLDEFIIQGPNGEHRCLVTDVLGPSLGGLTGDDRLYAFPVKLATRIAVQLAQAVAELHECGIVHGGMQDSLLIYT
jgi:serine/threonine-protein kinase SRPK3